MDDQIPVIDVSMKCLDKKRSFRVQKRMHEKIDDYAEYDFTSIQSSALNVFFDLSQEFDSFEDLLSIIVLIPKVFFDLECSLYLLREGQADKVATCFDACPLPNRDPDSLVFFSTPKLRDNSLYLPIKGNKQLIDQIPFNPPHGLMGVLEIMPAQDLSRHERLFFEKFANRVGFQLHMRMISKKNREHLQFIKTLVKDIGHNVIVPNMFFKLFYRRLEANIKALGELKNELQAAYALNEDQQIMAKMEYIHNGLQEHYAEIYRHYEQTSLFLETLLRRSHFEQGKYVLERKACNFKSQIIDPQVQRYSHEFKEKGIEIALAGVPDQEIEVVADPGLISQVYANLFSNAAKYTREVDDFAGNRVKFISYGWEHKPDYFGPDRHGIKLNVFSTGSHIQPEDREGLFREGFRAGNIGKEQGTGHGLFFIREIVELHGGVVGYEPTPLGNNFYFVLPLTGQA
ncbi:sensor histidine kinase [Desulfonatronovibrio hydrogenovorans]|uniref:sensor histidine kinase n=1 Tax=Desulfonatronovibrio hydrogenovorans TaxID=53245 RepID=UPI00048FE20F|nr:HAMP domain-containing sensor histidine kinase [Desulfonatronovibrio hydrogenovorans]